MSTTLPDWADVLASALVGVERRPVHSGLSTVDDPALGLLDAAAVLTAYRRAGVRPASGVRVPSPAPDEAVPEIGAAGRARLSRLLDQGPAGADGLDAEVRAELLVEWLAATARAGRRVPGELLPALLDAGRRERSLRPLVVAAGGARAGWLAARRSEWRYLTGERDESGAVDPGTWELGTTGQRVAYLANLRATDPDAARELLVAGWAGEGHEERAGLLGTLRTGLGPADEEFLEKALADRRKEVRVIAGELLGVLPGSAYRGRMVARATACVRREGDTLVVEPPTECDAAMKRDGIVPKPPNGVGERAWWLEQLLARTPVETWADPVAFLALPVPDGWEMVLLRGLAQAAVTARDPDWAAAVFDRLQSLRRQEWRTGDGDLFTAVIAAVPDERLAGRAVVLLGNDPTSDALDGLLVRCPQPWPPSLVDAFLAAFAGPAEKLGHVWRVGRLCRVAATRLPVDCLDRFAALATTVRAQVTDLAGRLDRLAAAGDRRAALQLAAGGDRATETVLRRKFSATEVLADSLDQLIEVLRFRHDLLEELQ